MPNRICHVFSPGSQILTLEKCNLRAEVHPVHTVNTRSFFFFFFKRTQRYTIGWEDKLIEETGEEINV